MITFSEAQLVAWLSPVLWPFLRVLAMFSVAPVFSQRVIPMRLKIGLAFLVAVCAQPVLGDQPVIGINSPQALGTQSSPPNQVIIGLSLFLTLFVMGPTLDRVYQEAYVPYTTNAATFEQAIEKAEAPMRDFMLKQTRQSDFALFARLAKLEAGVTAETAPLRVLVPAFVTSELKTAFQIGFMIFIPFLVIDMVVSSILMSLGMMMLSPVLVALPFKLMLFVLADGWNLLIGSLAASFAV